MPNNNKRKWKNKRIAVVALSFLLQSNCFHGSAAEDASLFDAGSKYHKAVEEFLQIGGKKIKKKQRKFFKEHEELIEDPEFGQLLFAWCTKELQYLTNGNEEQCDALSPLIEEVLN